MHVICEYCNSTTGDQVSKKGGMTGGFYDYKRSKLKLLSVIRENNKLVSAKQQELAKVRADLQNILHTLLVFCVRLVS